LIVSHDDSGVHHVVYFRIVRLDLSERAALPRVAYLELRVGRSGAEKRGSRSTWANRCGNCASEQDRRGDERSEQCEEWYRRTSGGSNSHGRIPRGTNVLGPVPYLWPRGIARTSLYVVLHSRITDPQGDFRAQQPQFRAACLNSEA
jgi:hypothetical protein